MKTKILYILLALALVLAVVGGATHSISTIFAAKPDGKVPSGGIGEYIPGGRNVEAFRYVHDERYPPFADRARWIGTLSGNWYQMGVQYGDRSDDQILSVSDLCWERACEWFGYEETLKAMELYEAQIAALDSNQIDFMQGMADGAASWLDQSPYADPGHEWYASNYARVLFGSVRPEWIMHHPLQFPDGSSTYGGSKTPPSDLCISMCSGLSARGQATLNGEVITTQNHQFSYDPDCYQQVYIINPPDGNVAWVHTIPPQVVNTTVVNEKGVSINAYSGGLSAWYQGEFICAQGFGVPLFNTMLYIGTHADTAEEAIEMLTVGTPEYRARTGRDSLLRTSGYLFLITDKDTTAVIETTADRYAVRYPGEYLGPEWTDTDYVAVNAGVYWCPFSYDAHNNLTDVPMTIFDRGYLYDPATGESTWVDTTSRQCFWTMMWDLRHYYGHIDKYMTQYIMSARYKKDEATGGKVECGLKDGNCVPWQDIGRTPATGGGGANEALRGGTPVAKLTVVDGRDTLVAWTMGTPYHWQGAWDEYYFKKRASK